MKVEYIGNVAYKWIIGNYEIIQNTHGQFLLYKNNYCLGDFRNLKNAVNNILFMQGWNNIKAIEDLINVS